jgi:hypothetical protein
MIVKETDDRLEIMRLRKTNETAQAPFLFYWDRKILDYRKKTVKVFQSQYFPSKTRAEKAMMQNQKMQWTRLDIPVSYKKMVQEVFPILPDPCTPPYLPGDEEGASGPWDGLEEVLVKFVDPLGVLREEAPHD